MVNKNKNGGKATQSCRHLSGIMNEEFIIYKSGHEESNFYSRLFESMVDRDASNL